MGIFKKHGDRPGLEPVTNIQLSEKHKALRWVLAGVLLVVGLALIGFGVSQSLEGTSGWRAVECTANETNCSQDFLLSYDFGRPGTNGGESRAVTLLYSQAAVDAFQIFSPDVEAEAFGNVRALNANPNQPVQVHPALYRALEQVCASGSRHVFLGEVYVQYAQVFRAESEILAAQEDPTVNAEAREYVGQLARFANDPAMVSLSLLGNDRAMLSVAPEYLAFARENDLSVYLDFGWMTNAFIADFIAGELAAAGHTHGYLVSYDGFTRNLDESGEIFRMDVVDRCDDVIYQSAVLSYTGPMALVNLRNYPMSDRDVWRYRVFSRDRIVSSLADPADGLNRTATDNLLAWSRNQSCGQMVLALAPVFIGEALDTQALADLADRDVQTLWAKGKELYCTDSQAVLELIPDSGYTEKKLP